MPENDSSPAMPGSQLPAPGGAPGQQGRTPPPIPRRGKSGGMGWLVFTLLLLGVLAVIAVLGMVALGSMIDAGASAQSKFQQVTLTGGSSGKKVVIIDIKGVIMSDANGGKGMSDDIVAELKTVNQDPDVVAVILDMDTPGGGVTASDEIHHAVQQLRKNGKKVITCMRGVAASGGYYIAAGTDHIIANRHTMTGSIGVIIGGFKMRELMDKIGLEHMVYKSGEFKDLLSMSRKEDPELDARENELIQGMINEAFTEFVKIVAEGRGLDEEVVRAAPIGDARILSGAEALELKLVDQLGYLDDAIAHARQDGDHSVVRIQRKPNPLEVLFSARSDRKSIEIHMIPEEWRALKKGRLYYLSPMFY